MFVSDFDMLWWADSDTVADVAYLKYYFSNFAYFATLFMLSVYFCACDFSVFSYFGSIANFSFVSTFSASVRKNVNMVNSYAGFYFLTFPWFF